MIEEGKIQKLSKSGIIDKKQEDKDTVWYRSLPRSKHFSVGSYVVYKNRRYEVLSYADDSVTLGEADTGETISLHRPYFMR